MITARRRFKPHKLLPWRWFNLLFVSPTATCSRRPHCIESLTKRRLLAAAPLELGSEKSASPIDSPPATPHATANPVEASRHAPSRQHVSDSVLSLVSQAKRRPTKQRPTTTEPIYQQVPQRLRSKPASPRRPGLFPQGDSAPPFRLPASIPQGLFRDGSVRAVHLDSSKTDSTSS